MYTKFCKLAGVVLLSATAAPMAANAADLYHTPPPPPASYVPPVVTPNTWAGFYVGINGGYGWGDGGNAINYNGLDQSTRAQPQGGFGGGQAGYNFQSGSFVYGVETDFQGAGLSDRTGGTTVGGNPFASSEHVDWFGTVRGRIGFAYDRALIYGTGGFAYGDVSQRANLNGDLFGNGGTQTGYAVGGGVEYKLTPSWSLKAEYQYIDFGSEKLTDSAGAATNELDTSFHTARLGLNYRFGGGYEPLK
jgi:outer membrane immunogenic protein